MVNSYSPQDWIKRAKSNLTIVKCLDLENLSEDIFLEDLCFDLQQSAEKALKSILVKYKYTFPKTHDIAHLLKIIKDNTTLEIPENIQQSKRLNIYAVKTRYPNWNKITKEEFDEAMEIAENVYNWAEEQIEK